MCHKDFGEKAINEDSPPVQPMQGEQEDAVQALTEAGVGVTAGPDGRSPEGSRYKPRATNDGRSATALAERNRRQEIRHGRDGQTDDVGVRSLDPRDEA